MDYRQFGEKVGFFLPLIDTKNLCFLGKHIFPCEVLIYIIADTYF